MEVRDCKRGKVSFRGRGVISGRVARPFVMGETVEGEREWKSECRIIDANEGSKVLFVKKWEHVLHTFAICNTREDLSLLQNSFLDPRVIIGR